jgi:hypothetical protein
MRHMLLREWVRQLSRRGFLRGSAATVASVAIAPTKIFAATPAPVGLQPDESRVLLKFTRDLFPHDRLDDSFYAKAIAPLQDEAATDAATQKLLAAGIAQLNAATMASAGKPYADVADEKIRVAAIQTIEGGAFFTKVFSGTVTPLYNQPALWPKFGYEGPSSALGGYINRGLSDIDWL